MKFGLWFEAYCWMIGCVHYVSHGHHWYWVLVVIDLSGLMKDVGGLIVARSSNVDFFLVSKAQC